MISCKEFFSTNVMSSIIKRDLLWNKVLKTKSINLYVTLFSSFQTEKWLTTYKIIHNSFSNVKVYFILYNLVTPYARKISIAVKKTC